MSSERLRHLTTLVVVLGVMVVALSVTNIVINVLDHFWPTAPYLEQYYCD